MNSGLQSTNNATIDVCSRVDEKLFVLIGAYKKTPAIRVAVDRSSYFMINYPDVFPFSLLSKAFKQVTLHNTVPAVRAGCDQGLCDWVDFADWLRE